MSADALRRALSLRERHYMQTIDRLREQNDSSEETGAMLEALREAVYLVGCLRRLTDGRTVEEIHRAYGAPGDFGYETAIGDALARLYGVIS